MARLLRDCAHILLSPAGDVAPWTGKYSKLILVLLRALLLCSPQSEKLADAMDVDVHVLPSYIFEHVERSEILNAAQQCFSLPICGHLTPNVQLGWKYSRQQPLAQCS